jgi:hypothetical protein
MSQAQQASQDPDAAKGFFSKMADSLKDVGDKMTNMSPAASQGLIAAGMSMLANNSGGRNLSQLVGEGGIAGVNEYQAVKQNQINAQLKQQELAQQQWYQQQQIATERNKLEAMEPGTSYTTAARTLQGQGPMVAGGPKVTGYQDYKDPTGVLYKYPVGYGPDGKYGQVGPMQVTDASWAQPQVDTTNKAISAASDANQALSQTQYYLNKIPTANIPGGLQGDFLSMYTKLGGDQTEGQALQQEIMRNMRGVSLQAFKSAVGNRVTQNEFNTMQAGLQGNLSGDALKQILEDYGHFQNVQAQRANMTAEYLQQNRGFMSALGNDSPGTIGGQRYPAGTQLNDIVSGVAKPIGAGANAGAAPSGGGNAPAPAAPATPVVNQAIAAARNGDKNAQAALQKRGISWS